MAGVTSTIPIQIGTTIVQFPNSGASPLWSEAVIQFAQLVAIQLQTQASPFDIAPTVMTLTNNINTDIPLTGNGSNLSFPSGQVRSFSFNYGVYRVSSTNSYTEEGSVTGVFNSDTSSWSIQHDYMGDVQSSGASWLDFDMNGNDELVLTTALIPGVYDGLNSKISYSARTELVST